MMESRNRPFSLSLLICVLALFSLPQFALAQDVTPPQLTAFSFTPTAIDATNGPATVTVNFTITDDSSGVAYFETSFVDPNGIVVGRASKLLSGGLSASSSVTMTFPQFSNPGTYTVGGVYITDVAGNGAILNTAALSAAGFNTSLGVASAIDTIPPSLTALSLSSPTIDTTAAPAVLTANFSASDNLTGVKVFQITFVSPSGALQLSGTVTVSPATSVTGSTTVTFPQFTEAGTWIIAGVSVIDAAGNSSVYSSAQLATAGFPSSVNVTSASDTTPPALTAFSFTPSSIDTTSGPATVTVSFTATDNLAGVKSFQVAFTSPSGVTTQQATANINPPSTSATGSATLTFQSFGESGTWTVTGVSVADAAGNVSNLATSDLTAANFPTTLTVTTWSDTNPPALNSLSFSPSGINVVSTSAQVTVNYQVSDDLSGVTTFQAAFISPSGEGIQAASDNFAATTSRTASATATFPKGSEDGVWTLGSVYLADAAGNTRLYGASDLTARGIATQLTVSSKTQPPVATGQSQTVSYPGPASFPLNASDPSGATLTYHQTSAPTKGTVSVTCTTTCTATYTPNFGAGGSDSFNYYVSNPSNLTSATALVNITIQAVDVTSLTTITAGTVTFNRGTGAYTGTYTVKNTSSAAIAAPLQFVLTSIPSGASVVNATGTVPSGPYAGSPYITVAGTSPLAAGASVNVTVTYKNPGGATWNAVPKVLSGGF